MVKKTAGLAASAALALTLAACGGAAGESAEVESYSQWGDEDEERFQTEYAKARTHLLDNYGILESGELCEAFHSPDEELFTSTMISFAADAGIAYDSEVHPGDNGAWEAVLDWCTAD